MKEKKVLVVLICIIMCGLSFVEIFGRKVDYSENENRHLASWPELSIDTFFDGTYVEGMESYLCDHFPMRDKLMGMYALSLRAQGATEVNNVYICDEGYLIEKNESYENLDKIVRKINGFNNKINANGQEVNISVMLVPTSITINSEILPSYADKGNELEAINYIYEGLRENISKIRVDETLKKENSNFQTFYKTDHHWTTYGAYFAYKEYAKSMNFSYHMITDYDIFEVSSNFKGTVYSKVNDLTTESESITAFYQKQNLTIQYQNSTSDSLYNKSYLEQKDKYSFFLNNINDKIIIKNNDVQNGRKLLVIKDSYANCFIPFITEYFEEIIVLDTRYYMYGASPIVDKENITDVLILYNMRTIDEDEGINGIY